MFDGKVECLDNAVFRVLHYKFLRHGSNSNVTVQIPLFPVFVGNLPTESDYGFTHARTHTRTDARTHAYMHARTHTHYNNNKTHTHTHMNELKNVNVSFIY